MSVRSPMEWPKVAAQRRDPVSLLSWIERLIRRRRECPELGWGRMTLLDAGDEAVLAHRADWDGSAIVAVHSLAEAPRRVRLDVGDTEAAVDLFADEELAPDGGRIEVALGRYGQRWLRLRRPGQSLAP